MAQQDTPQAISVPAWTLADRLRKARESAGLHQTELAADLGISRSSISTYESGTTTPKRPVLLTWAMRCGVPLEWLRDGVEPSTGPDDPSDLRGSASRRKGDVIEIGTKLSLRSAEVAAA